MSEEDKNLINDIKKKRYTHWKKTKPKKQLQQKILFAGTAATAITFTISTILIIIIKLLYEIEDLIFQEFRSQ